MTRIVKGAERVHPLADHVAVVTGGSGGIGSAIAEALAGDGAWVALVGRDPARLGAAADHVAARSGHPAGVSFHTADLALDGDIRRLVEEVMSRHGHVDILVHSAGVISTGTIAETPVDDFDRQYQVNVRAAYLLTQSLLPTLKERRGQVVFINSSVGLSAAPGSGPYSATKHALKAIADSLRQEVNADGVRVITVYPGQTASPMQAELYRTAGRVYVPESLLQPADVAEAVAGALRLPRTAEVTDISIRPMQKPAR